MDTQALVCFIKVVHCGSIAEASRHLNIAPTTIAQRIRTLESQIGCALVQRSGRTVKPTTAGIGILKHASDILKSVDAIYASASNTDLPPGPLRLGATPTVVASILPDVLAAWSQRFPTIDVFIQPDITRKLYDKLLCQELDLAILTHPRFKFDKTCVWKQLRAEKLILLSHRDVKVTDVLDTLASESFIRYDRQTVAGALINDYLDVQKISIQARFELDGIFPIAELVARQLGVAILPDSPVINRFAPSVRKWPLPPPCPYRVIGALWERASIRSRLTEAFVDVAVHHLSVT